MEKLNQNIQTQQLPEKKQKTPVTPKVIQIGDFRKEEEDGDKIEINKEIGHVLRVILKKSEQEIGEIAKNLSKENQEIIIIASRNKKLPKEQIEYLRDRSQNCVWLF